MGGSNDWTGDPSGDRPAPETSTRRVRDLSQRDFEIEFLGGVLERDPYFAEAIRVHAGNLAAKGLYSQALRLDNRLVRLLPEDCIAWYNLACSYSMLGMLDPAFSSLQRAFELGYRCQERLRRDPDLGPLRDDPRFLRLIRRFEFIL